MAIKMEVIEIKLEDYKTCELVNELAKRDGVKERNAEPYEKIVITIEGPARVLTVVD